MAINPGERPPQTRVPAETVDMIIDHLHDCKGALKCCALVSHAWLPSSRFHLFRRIDLYTYSKGYQSHYPNPCDQLYAAIQRSPSIAAIIQELHIREGNNEKGQDWINATPSLVSFLNSLTRLNTLHLRRADWIYLTSNLRGALRRVFVSNPVSNVIFEICSFPFSSFLSILNTCSKPTSLTLKTPFYISGSDIQPEGVKTVEEEEVGNVRPESKCQFHDLRIVSSPGAILSWSNDPVDGPDLSLLRTLHCDVDAHSRALLLRLGSGLHHLRITAPYILRSFSERLVLPLEHNTGLRSLRVTGLAIHDTTSYGIAGTDWLKRQLPSVIDALHLQQIFLEVPNINEDPIKYRDAWATVDDIFDGDAFPELTRVEINPSVFWMSNDYWEPSSVICEKMTSFFPRLQERKILDVCWNPCYD